MANEGAPNEICGFLMRDDPACYPSIVPCRNIAKDPQHHFEIHPEDLLKAYEREEDIVGMYHSHPRGPEGPSEADRKYAPPGGMRYFIVTLTHVYEHDMETA
jgi:proteasome lid subunit RPN8/RPN11